MQAFFASLAWFLAGAALAQATMMLCAAVRRWGAERVWRRERLKMVAALARKAGVDRANHQ